MTILFLTKTISFLGLSLKIGPLGYDSKEDFLDKSKSYFGLGETRRTINDDIFLVYKNFC
jgi:hypothetical protein